MQKEFYYTVILKRKPGTEGFILTIPSFDELGEIEGSDAEELVNRATEILGRHLEMYRDEERPIPIEMNIKVKVTLPDDEG